MTYRSKPFDGFERFLYINDIVKSLNHYSVAPSCRTAGTARLVVIIKLLDYIN